MSKPKIFAVVISKFGNDDFTGGAIAEDGTYIAGHISSSLYWLEHDLGAGDGCTCDTGECRLWKHDYYRKHYPEGFEVVFLGICREGENEELDAALKLNRERGDAA